MKRAKRTIRIAAVVFLLLSLFAVFGQKCLEEIKKWDCTVTCTEKSDEDSYVITYSDNEIIASTGTLTLQNRNNFDIVVHLLADGQEERLAEVGAGGVAVLFQLKKDVVYTAGCHADVEEGTEIRLMVYDGEGAEVY